MHREENSVHPIMSHANLRHARADVLLPDQPSWPIPEKKRCAQPPENGT